MRVAATELAAGLHSLRWHLARQRRLARRCARRRRGCLVIVARSSAWRLAIVAVHLVPLYVVVQDLWRELPSKLSISRSTLWEMAGHGAGARKLQQTSSRSAT